MLLLTSKRGYTLVLFFCWIKPFHYASGQFFNIDPEMPKPEPFCSDRKGPNKKDIYATPTTCFEALDPTTQDNIEIGALYAEGMSKIINHVYPEEVHDVREVFMPYDEPLHPIPVGASVFYIIMIAWIVTFYFTYLGRKLLIKFQRKLDLHPESDRFPNLPLCWLQQGKREAELRREVRNTWAWLARRYLLSPNDPLLANVDQVLGLVNWHDFEVSRDTWSLVKVILTMNAMYVKVRKHKKEGRKSFEIIKDVNLAKRKSMEDDPIQITRVFEDVNTDKAGNYVGGATLPDDQKAKKADAGMEKPKRVSVESEGRRGRDLGPVMSTVSTPASVKARKKPAPAPPPPPPPPPPPKPVKPVEVKKEPKVKPIHKKRAVRPPPPPPPETPSKPFHWMKSKQTFSWMQNETPAVSETTVETEATNVEPSEATVMEDESIATTMMEDESIAATVMEDESIATTVMEDDSIAKTAMEDESIATTVPTTTDTEATTTDADYTTDNPATSTDVSVAGSVRKKRRRRRRKKKVRIGEVKRWEYFYKP